MVQWDPNRYRPQLYVMVRCLHLDRRLQRRFDSSDLVQETLLRAVQGLDDCRAQTDGERIKWLQRILVNAARDKIAEHKAAKRNLDLEKSLQAVVADSSARLEAWAAAEQSSPSQQAQRHELSLQVAEALVRLPTNQQDAILLHHASGASVSQIAQRMGCTTKAVAGLLYRGLKKLREILQQS